MLTNNQSLHTISPILNPLANPLAKPLAKKPTLTEPNHQKLWSNLEEIGEVLHIPLPQTLFHEDDHFQHVNYRAGQRIFTLAQKFDALYLVHSGFLKSV